MRPDFAALIPSVAKFAAAQKALMARGGPDDPCAACGCKRKHHLPPRTYSYAKTGGSSGNSHNVYVLAPTCCHSPESFCSCVAFREKDDPSVRGVYLKAADFREPPADPGAWHSPKTRKTKQKPAEIPTIFRD